jgi:hypothetical protein
VSDENRRLPSRRFAMALAAVPLVAVLLAEAGLALRDSTDSTGDNTRAAPRSTSTTQGERAESAAAARAAAIRDLTRRRAHAVMHHDRAEWRSTLDPVRPAFRREQLKLFDNLRDVPLRSWRYSFDTDQQRPPVPRSTRYGAPSWSPLAFRLHYRLRGFDRRATSLMQYPTFVQRDGSWYFASFDDFRGQDRRSATDLWDFGPVSVVRTDDVLVLGHPDTLPTMQALAVEVAADIPRVTAVWGSDWARRVVVLVPSTQHELSQVVNDYGDLSDIAAVATAEVTVGAGDPNPVGDRIGINPANWPKLSLLGRRIVITHELTHVASRALTSAATPKWLAEGFADYVGYLGSGVPTTFVAQDLRDAVLAGKDPQTFPTDESFRGSSERLSQSYEASWLACQLIAQRWGQSTLVRFYEAVGRSHERPGAAVAAAATRVLHISSHELMSRWRSYVRSELS